MGKGEAERKKFLLRMPGFGTNRSSGGGRVVVSSCRHHVVMSVLFFCGSRRSSLFRLDSSGLIHHQRTENSEQRTYRRFTDLLFCLVV